MAFPNFTAASLASDAILGLNLLTGSLKGDVVGILDQKSFKQLFPETRPMKAIIRETSQVMKHPVESGATLSDHKIINPKSIEMMMLIDSQFYSSDYQQIRTAWLNSTLLIVQTKAAVYQNMIIQNLPREEDPDKFDVTTIHLQMEEVLFELPNSVSSASSVSYYSPKDPTNESIVARGLQSSLITPATSLLSLIHASSVWGIH